MSRTKIENALYILIATCGVVIVILLLIGLSGCSQAPETIIRDRYITLKPEIIHDTVSAVATDTLIVATKVIEKDTVAVIKYYPKLKYMDYTITPDTIKLMLRDTIKQIVEKKIETPLLSKLGLICTGVMVGFAGILLLKWRLK